MTTTHGTHFSPSCHNGCYNKRLIFVYTAIVIVSVVCFSFQIYVLHNVVPIHSFRKETSQIRESVINKNSTLLTRAKQGDTVLSMNLRQIEERWGGVNDSLLQKRMSELPLSQPSLFSFVHISKTAGTSWILELRDILERKQIKPRMASGIELSVRVQKKMYGSNNNTYLMTSFKHPRAHVWSLWAQCCFATDWGRVPKIPYSESISYEENFENWLDIFLRPKNNINIKGNNSNQTSLNSNDKDNNNTSTPTIDNSNNTLSKWEFSNANYPICYHPANYQTRPFAVRSRFPVKMLENRSMVFEHNLTTIRTVRDTDFAWIGISEFFHESKCLLYHRWNKHIFKTNLSHVKVPKIQNFLNEYCHCNPTILDAAATNTTNNKMINQQQKQQQQQQQHQQQIKKRKDSEANEFHVTHYNEGRRSTTTDLHPRILAKIDALTRIDTINYRESLLQFFLEVANMELELNRRVLCDKSLQRWETELTYLNLPQSLSDLHESAKFIIKAKYGEAAAELE